MASATPQFETVSTHARPEPTQVTRHRTRPEEQAERQFWRNTYDTKQDLQRTVQDFQLPYCRTPGD